ncbi:MAG: NB-ARC domain-containing protein, partial [Thermosynechococcaceae cyanobacterium]
ALERLKRHLRRQRVGILIDNLESALDSQGQWRAAQRNDVELLRILADPLVQGLTLITSRDRLCEPSVTVDHYRLPGLSLAAWEQAFTQQQIPIHAESLQAMHHAYGGNAKAMHILAGGIQTEYGGEMDTYWAHSSRTLLAPTDLKNLIEGQLQRLQQLDPMAYRLFCRLGCYRYQDVPTIPLAGVLVLLWDCPEAQRRAALVALQNRSLIEVRKGEYSLHPVLREAAILHLQDPVETHRAAAQFWTDHVRAIQSTQDALQALEAHYHYRAIGDAGKAGRVILKSRLNQWHQYLPLGSTLYRMGLLQPLLAAIPTIIEPLQGDYTLSELYNILADAYWITGQVWAAIAAQETALTLSDHALAILPEGPEQEKSRYYYTMLGIDSRLSMGLYCLDLWELEQAASWFQGVMTAVQGTPHTRWAEKAAVCLALTQSYLGQTELAYQQANEIYQTLCCDRPIENRGSAAYFLQLLGQTYVNLGDFVIAEILFEKVLSFSTASHYTQVQAKTLTGLAMMQRHQQNFERAIAVHREAIALLEGIGARCDLAEAYYQLGVTYGTMHQVALRQDWFSKAIRLFAAMDAPHQVSKVQASYSEQGIS